MTFVRVFAVVILAMGLVRVWLLARAGEGRPWVASRAPSILRVSWIVWQAGLRRVRFERTRLTQDIASLPEADTELGSLGEW